MEDKRWRKMHAYIQDLSILNVTFSGLNGLLFITLKWNVYFQVRHTRIELRSTCTWL
jgi:hypothetical protein